MRARHSISSAIWIAILFAVGAARGRAQPTPDDIDREVRAARGQFASASAAFSGREPVRSIPLLDQVVLRLETLRSGGVLPASGKSLLSSAYELRALACFSAGQKDKASRSFIALLELTPEYALDRGQKAASPDLWEFYVSVKRALVGYVAAASDPPGARVTLVRKDGSRQLLGITDFFPVEVLAGEYVVEIEHDGYETRWTDLSLSARDTQSVEVKLTRRTLPNAVVTTDPAGVEILLDGRLVVMTAPGPTPFGPSERTELDVQPGSHVLEFRKTCYVTTRRTLDTPEIRRYELEPVRLERDFASLRLSSEPPGARILVNGEDRGATPADLQGVCAGNVHLELRHADGSVSQDLLLQRGQTATLHLQLRAPDHTGRNLVLALLALLGVGGLLLLGRRRLRAAGDEDPRTITTVAAPAKQVLHERFGDYTLVALLGAGGMANVYEATRRGDPLALKRPRSTLLNDPEFVERFLREAELGRTLHHPNIVRIFEQGHVERVPYFTMELVKGETLQARIRRGGAVVPRSAAEIAGHVAEALDYAHLKGVVHRDLKPSNIMMVDRGRAKVMDYGIARAARFDGLTVTGSFMGTAEYASPETAEGRPADPRSDLYSLGVILFELLTGQKPFVADTPLAVLRKHCTAEPTPPRRLVPAIPRELEAIVLRLLSKDPARRHPSAEALLQDLRDYLTRVA